MMTFSVVLKATFYLKIGLEKIKSVLSVGLPMVCTSLYLRRQEIFEKYLIKVLL
jgi:hypothetical protein